MPKQDPDADRKKTPRALYWLATAALLAALVSVRSRPERGLAAGSPAPPFHLLDIAGKPASLSEYRGKVVLLDFWATWCAACLSELPELKRIYGRFRGQGFEILAASMDEEGRSAAAPFAARHGLPYRVLLADPATARSYRVWGLPSKYLIDREGRIHRKYIGEVPVTTVEADIQDLLGAETSITSTT